MRTAVVFDSEYLIKEVTKDGKTLKIGVFGVIDPRLYPCHGTGGNGRTYIYGYDGVFESGGSRPESQGCQIVIGIAHCIQPAAGDGISNTVSGGTCGLTGMGAYDI